MTPQREIVISVHPETGCAIASIPADVNLAAISVSSLEAACMKAGVEVTDDVRRTLAALAEKRLKSVGTATAAADEIIARPTLPVHGENGRIEWSSGCNPQGGEAAQASTDDVNDARVDHYAGRTYLRVAAGGVIGTLHPPTAGTEGRDVCGKPLRPRPGSPCPLRLDSTIKAAADGTLTAQIDGVLSIKRGTISISRLLEVPEHVDFTTGHIDFDGAIDIRQDVRDLFKIKATGDITIGGLIEAATITCGGDFTCRRGMAGRERGVLKVAGASEIGFLNDMTGVFGGTLTVRREIMNCILAVEGVLDAEQATVIGGAAELHGGGSIATLGARSGRCTRIILPHDRDLHITKMLHGGVQLQLGERTWEIDDATKGPLRIRVAADGGSLSYQVADGPSRAIDEIAHTLRAAA